MTAEKTMRAWQSGDPGLPNLAIRDLPLPEPGDGEMLVRVAAAALNFSDLLMVDDLYQVRPQRPFTPGQEIAGVVVAAGKDVPFAIGDRVASKVLHGGFAEQALVRGDMALRVPDGMAFSAAVSLPVVYTTAMVALTESTIVRPGETVLVLAAAGGVGLAAIQIARHFGARVIAAAGGTDKCALALANGADHAVDYRAKGWRDEVAKRVGGNGIDVIVDPVGGEMTAEALRLIGWGGRLLIVGFSSGEIPRIAANRLLLRRASAIGVYWNHDRDGPMISRVSDRLAELAGAGAIRPHVGATFAFPDLPQALRAMADRNTTGKALILFDTETTA